MPRVVPAKTEPEDGFMSGLHHDPPPLSPGDFAIGRTRLSRKRVVYDLTIPHAGKERDVKFLTAGSDPAAIYHLLCAQ